MNSKDVKDSNEIDKLPYVALKNLKLNEASLRTGLVYHELMADYRCLYDINFPECPERFKVILNRIKELGLDERCQRLKARPATQEEITLIHTKELYDTLKSTQFEKNLIKLEKLASKYDSVYFHENSFDASLLAAGSSIDLVQKVASGEIKNGFALIRPPGHHALIDAFCGYCYFNNAALAAAHAVKNLGVEKILIVDWDVHHGQGIQHIFYDNPNVLYFSLHKYLFGAFWPELIESNYNFTGSGKGIGFNVNFPLNVIGLNNCDFFAIFHNVLLPIAYEYNPNLIIISAGYDSAIGCPEGRNNITPAMYAHMCHMLMGLANGKVCVLLEGGYCLSSLAESAALTLRTLLGDPCPELDIKPFSIHQAIIDSVLDVIWALKPYWKMLRTQEEFHRHDSNEKDSSNPTIRKHYPVIEYRGKAAFQDRPTEYTTRDFYEKCDEETQLRYEEEIKSLIERTNLNKPSLRTCLKYDEAMNQHLCVYSSHPERPSRITSIYKRLTEDGFLQNDQVVLLTETRYATEEELTLVHQPDYVEKMKSLSSLKFKAIKKIASSYESLYLNNKSYDAARLACGGLLQVVDSVLSGKTLNGFAIIRPPGHHASQNEVSGFCIFNNVSIAAKYAISKYNLQRVLIVDWDVHHGNGTQNIFQNDPNVLFISIHRYDYALFFPSTLDSGFTTPKNIINIPWNGGPMSDYDYLLAFFNIILPVANEFNPELVLISSGFDAAINDALGEYKLSPEVYGHFTHLLCSLANGKVVIALEGGYNLESLSSAASNCISVLLGNAPRQLASCSLNCNSIETIQNVTKYHSSFWSSLAFTAQLPFNDKSD